MSARTVELAGPMGELEFPQICANCGNATDQTLLVEKVFQSRAWDDDGGPEVAGAQVPFCPDCISRHRRDAKTITLVERFFLCFHSGSMLGIIFYPLLGLFLFFVASRVSRGGGILAAIGAFFMLAAWFDYRRAFDETRWRAVQPLTSITSAFDFGAIRGELFDGERRIFTLRNPYFAEVFITRNHARVWDPQSARALRAEAARNRMATAALVALGIWLVWEFGSGLLVR